MAQGLREQHVEYAGVCVCVCVFVCGLCGYILVRGVIV